MQQKQLDLKDMVAQSGYNKDIQAQEKERLCECHGFLAKEES